VAAGIDGGSVGQCGRWAAYSDLDVSAWYDQPGSQPAISAVAVLTIQAVMAYSLFPMAANIQLLTGNYRRDVAASQ